VGAAEKAIMASTDIVAYSDVTLLVPHAVSMIFTSPQHDGYDTTQYF